ncbi:hypothetical protein PC9H_003652 [Pleurotus ostreatus]|uniref:P-loop containing nucleoside triphosphate hydrolase protein n=2 Tax=Pleurotus TaxID=5320 RepID=A0A8H7DU41_PLEOS|nr:uncharacterized protein PC9H_003652 [Pleurotus ostreatus]KAF7436819.1 hypothetical protein PC9H_003652 [Pleurotus ostreatus]KAG9222812.1 hypothetical protein CCMSSC00406_0000499 [Pleurotus cornucopiae]
MRITPLRKLGRCVFVTVEQAKLNASHSFLPSSHCKGPTLKRSFAHQATATLRASFEGGSQEAGPSSLSRNQRSNAPATQRATPTPLVSPQFKMLPSSSSSRRGAPRGKRGSPLVSSSASNSRGKGKQKEKGDRGRGDRGRSGFDPPIHDKAYILKTYRGSNPLKAQHEDTPKSSIGNFCMIAISKLPDYKCTQGTVVESSGKRTLMWRTTVVINVDPPIEGVGDSTDKKESEKLAALSAVYQLDKLGLLENPRSLNPSATVASTATLSDGSSVTYEQARSFMDYYCRRFRFGKPDLTYNALPGSTWEAVMTVDERRIGLGKGPNKKASQTACYLDVTQYLEKCDSDLWKAYVEAAKTGDDLGLAPKVFFQVSSNVADRIQALCADIKKSELYKNRPAPGPTEISATMGNAPRRRRIVGPEVLAQKSQKLLQRHEAYLADARMERMRTTRASLPVYTRARDILAHVAANDVTICMAATGSGKTTQIPQLILDDYIKRGDGSSCNIICTQPRRLAAISVADRVSKERGESLGHSVGYHVRFENKLPEDNGSITFCTTGIFLKRMHSALSGIGDAMSTSDLDSVTHIIVDEVHERDLDTDLTLVVLKRFLSDRKARNKPLKVILMSATINPTLFQNYFPDTQGMPAKVIEVPGRSFPVVKHFLDDFVPQLVSEQPNRWVFSQEPTIKYLVKELGVQPAAQLGIRLQQGATINDNELELPFAFIALTISHVLQRTDSGHVLVFLPGWEEIQSVQKALLSPQGPTRLNFNDRSKYSIHLLHSSIPLPEQQVVFEPPPDGVRRIILATNIAETSVTIPDVVYVVDTAKVKEQRYDPDRHMSSLVSAWVGSSNLNQRAGRAGRHRPGEYFGILGQKHAQELHPHQTVEMKRVDLSNVVMHVKALDFPGMAVEDVLAACIEPPSPERVVAAMKDLFMVGALDEDQNLTSLGRLLLQLPVEVQMGRLVLYGSFFRCLDDALTLAAIMTNRDPFVSPLHRRKEAQERKGSWCPPECRSDVLTTLRAYNAWWAMQSRGEYVSANRFCLDNFLAKPTLLLIQKIKTHLLQSLNQAGVLDISGGGTFDASSSRMLSVPPELNTNRNSIPVLQALITIASQPKFSIRTGEMTYRTQQDKKTFIHPSSVNHRKHIASDTDAESAGERQLFAFLEKRQNASVVGSTPQTYQMTTTRLDPLTYMLFGAYKLEVVERGIECDGWLPIVGNLDALDDVQRLKISVDACMLRVFEGITMARRQRPRPPTLSRDEEPREDEDDEQGRRDLSLSRNEIRELDYLSRDIVNILKTYASEREQFQSRASSRSVTPIGSPIGSPSFPTMRLPRSSSGYSTPAHHGLPFSSRPGTPSRLSRRF